ncbi:hypothetical protein LSH36_106g03009 [Paralvinella palmiformis]|uniref:RING finger and CHY zinc finger domain-containing protein 1 n=1 Tax=Paralvinella palmiformis TaxID=53620 RepID=A0AAD9JYW5_9ANNE|nr:hypothetical protein LSH36_106g03009 [Paralvinella palmiformis]
MSDVDAEPPKGKESEYGCSHYKRRCAFISPCCKKVYVCRICHNENERHEIDRHAIQEIKCTECGTIQGVSNECTKCGVSFGKYFCLMCRLYDDEDKGQFHCSGCGICRIGGRENFFHCEQCNCCLGLSLKAGHKCLENASRSNCPVCLEDLHTSRLPIEVPRCGHYIHQKCFRDMVKYGGFTCPICGESYTNMKTLWQRLDEEIADTPMPDEYRNINVDILCKDCHKESTVPFHVIGLKCQQCGSYNTCRTDKGATSAAQSLPPPSPPEVHAGDNVNTEETEEDDLLRV